MIGVAAFLALPESHLRLHLIKEWSCQGNKELCHDHCHSTLGGLRGDSGPLGKPLESLEVLTGPSAPPAVVVVVA